MPDADKLEKINIDERYMLFQSCSVSNKCPGIEGATKAVFLELGIFLEESSDQTCCGGSAIIFTAIGQVFSTLLMASRNLAIAEEMCLNTLTMCNGCYKNLVEFSAYLNDNSDIKNEVNELLGQINKKYSGSSNIYHVLEILYSLKGKINEKVTRPLNGLKFATHYGCHYLYGAKKSAIDDPFYPGVIEEIIRLLGGEVVEYSENRSCCGSGVLNNTYIEKDAAMNATMRKLDSLNETKADAVIVTCPYCLMTLDRMQYQMGKGLGKSYNIPVLYISQMVGLAMGLSLVNLGFDSHVTYPGKLLEKVRAHHE